MTIRPFLGRLIRYLVFFVAGVFLFLITAYYVIPPIMLEDWVKGYAQSSGIYVSNRPAERVFPFGYEAKEVDITADGMYLARIGTLRAEFKPLGLFTGKLKVHITGSIGDGELVGDVTRKIGSTLFEIEERGVELKDLQFLASYGLTAAGSLESNLVVERSRGCPKGFFKVISNGLKGAQIRFFGLPLSVGDIDDAGLSVRFSNCSALIDGVWLEGDQVSARLKGEASLKTPVASSVLSAKLELIPRGELLKKEYLFGAIQQYRKSANYYLIPVSGTIERPRIGE